MPDMPHPALLDHILVAVMVLVEPFYGAWTYRRLVRRIRAGDTHARAAAYRHSMLMSWTWTIGLAAFWWGAGRPAAALGLAAPDVAQLLVGTIITCLALAALYAQWRALSTLDEKGLAALRAQMTEFADILPRTDREGALFRGVSVTAGVCEEIWCRGFLIWYLAAFVGQWPAVLLGALVFGAAHLYQGRSGVIKTGVTGLVMGILYVGTGSLLFPVILHTAMDLHGGATARHVLGAVTDPTRHAPASTG